MEKRICLDSDIIINLLRKNLDIRDEIKKLEGVFYITSISYFELIYGLKDKERFPLDLRTLDFTREDGILSGKIIRDLKNKGEILEVRDIFIASICINNNTFLFTKNIKHFKRLKKYGLKLIKI